MGGELGVARELVFAQTAHSQLVAELEKRREIHVFIFFKLYFCIFKLPSAQCPVPTAASLWQSWRREDTVKVGKVK